MSDSYERNDNGKIDASQETDVVLTIGECVAIGAHLNDYLDKIVPIVQEKIKEVEEKGIAPTAEYLELVERTGNLVRVHRKMNDLAESIIKSGK